MAAVLAMSLPLLASSDQPGPDDASLVRGLLADQQEAWNIGNLDAFLEAYDREEIVFASGGSIRRGWDDLRARYMARYDTPEKMGTLEFTIEQMDWLGTDYMKVLGRWALERRDDRPHGLFTLILKRRPEGWRIIHDHTSSAED